MQLSKLCYLVAQSYAVNETAMKLFPFSLIFFHMVLRTDSDHNEVGA